MQRDGHKKNGGGNVNPSDHLFTQRNVVFTTLVVESKANFIGDLEDFLKAEGHYILRSETAAEALAMTRQHWPDLILLNKEMNGSNSMKFLPELLIAHPSAAVIMMATKPSVSEAVDAMRLGAVDYLERPLDTKRLKDTIDSQKTLYRAL